jgi:uncharacterized Zn-binding protein involved in type VI secretion
MVGDTTTHGGIVITGSPMTNIKGIPIARKGGAHRNVLGQKIAYEH